MKILIECKNGSDPLITASGDFEFVLIDHDLKTIVDADVSNAKTTRIEKIISEALKNSYEDQR